MDLEIIKYFYWTSNWQRWTTLNKPEGFGNCGVVVDYEGKEVDVHHSQVPIWNKLKNL